MRSRGKKSVSRVRRRRGGRASCHTIRVGIIGLVFIRVPPSDLLTSCEYPSAPSVPPSHSPPPFSYGNQNGGGHEITKELKRNWGPLATNETCSHRPISTSPVHDSPQPPTRHHHQSRQHRPRGRPSLCTHARAMQDPASPFYTVPPPRARRARPYRLPRLNLSVLPIVTPFPHQPMNKRLKGTCGGAVGYPGSEELRFTFFIFEGEFGSPN